MSTIGPYQLLETLGQGGMGVVHRARHCETGEIVALKTILVADELQLQGIRREIRALSRIRYPGIVRIMAEGIHEGLPWYSMNFVVGQSLRQYFSRQSDHTPKQAAEIRSSEFTLPVGWTGSSSKERDTDRTVDTANLSPGKSEKIGQVSGSEAAPPKNIRGEMSKVLQLVRRLCATLAFLHGEGIVHRDLKPDNIIVQSDGTPILVDFGLMTQFSGEESRETLTVEYGGAGTVSYIAPEQIRGEFVDARADLYALGCILYELLVGHPPFFSPISTHVIQAHLHATAAVPSCFRPEVPGELDELVSRLLAKDPRDRVGHASVVSTTAAQFSDEKLVIEGPQPRPYLYRSSFAGRDVHLAQLREYVEPLLNGRGDIVLVSGESGLGKTRLVMEFGREVARQDIQVITGECTERAGYALEAFQKPLQAIADRCREKGQK
ncbi:protein kinase, partial [candidate division CSSED10-310 bacterium]